MPLIATIALVIVLVAFRLLVPPVPNLVGTYFRRWGKRTTIVLCTISLVVATLAILVSRG